MPEDKIMSNCHFELKINLLLKQINKGKWEYKIQKSLQ